MTTENIKPTNFIKQIIENELSNLSKKQTIVTRFPPEPNGFLHIGHAKSIILNFEIAKNFAGFCNLRMDDTNPEKEHLHYVKAIQADIAWLGYQWENMCYSSDYFEPLYQYAITLINEGKAYVDSLTATEIRENRGTLTQPGKNSPYRERNIAENLSLFQAMKNGECPEGSHVLRAKIDMQSSNLNMRDPTLYRIRFSEHYRKQKQWCIYPLYDYTHCISDAIEGITHSLCTLEFEDHRPLYNWILQQLKTINPPQQIEFSRLELEYTVMSKRKLNRLVIEKFVEDWDDPRMPTIAGMRRRGYTAEAVKEFCHRIGVTKKASQIEMGVLENCIREQLNQIAPRAMAVLRPLKVVLINFHDEQAQWINANNHPQDESLGQRALPFTKTLYIEQDDFLEDAPKKFFRLAPGKEVRLRHAYVIKCEQVIKDNAGKVIELQCSIDYATLGKKPEGRKVKGVIHWVSSHYALNAEIRLYDRLFNQPYPDAEEDFTTCINPDSLTILKQCKLEPSLETTPKESRLQFERQGYFYQDTLSEPNQLIFNRIVTLRDSWEKIEKSNKQ